MIHFRNANDDAGMVVALEQCKHDLVDAKSGSATGGGRDMTVGNAPQSQVKRWKQEWRPSSPSFEQGIEAPTTLPQGREIGQVMEVDSSDSDEDSEGDEKIEIKTEAPDFLQQQGEIAT